MQPGEPKIEIKSEVSSHDEKKERPKYFQTDKPLACVESNVAIAKLKEAAGEVPYAIWYDSIKKYQVLMMVNVEAKTVTIMEYIPTPKEFLDSGDTQYVCFLTMGLGLYINNKVKATTISFRKEN